jgi:hypothetical protein
METKTHLVKNIDNISKTFMNSISIEGYFSFNPEKKKTTQYLLLKFITKSILNEKIKTDKSVIKTIIDKVEMRSSHNENYELSEISKDLKINIDLLFEMTNDEIIKKPNKKRKISDKEENS